MRPFDINTINPEMRRTVEWLRSLGFKTTDSGDGHTNADNGMEGTIPEPHVAMVVLARDLIDEADRLASEVIDAGIDLDGLDVRIEAMYQPTNQSAGIVMLFGVNDAKLAAGEGGDHG